MPSSARTEAAPDGDWMVLNAKHATATKLLFDDQQIRDALTRVAELAEIPPFPGTFPSQRYVDEAWTPAWRALFAQASTFGRDIRKKNPNRLKLTLAVKAGLIVSDSVSSGLVREGFAIKSWIRRYRPQGGPRTRRD